MIGYLLDTCAISDGRRPQHYPKLAVWLATVDPEASYISAATVAEIQYGIARHPNEHQRRTLTGWLTEIVRAFGDRRLLDIDQNVAFVWGTLRHDLERAGAPYSTVDAIIAATAITHGLTVVTRNVRHFQSANVTVLNPWEV